MGSHLFCVRNRILTQVTKLALGAFHFAELGGQTSQLFIGVGHFKGIVVQKCFTLNILTMVSIILKKFEGLTYNQTFKFANCLVFPASCDELRAPKSMVAQLVINLLLKFAEIIFQK